MGCCKCEEHGWREDLITVYIDPSYGTGYCIFHAPAGEKNKDLVGDAKYTVEEYNRLVFQRIDIAITAHTPCRLTGVIFPGDVSFSSYIDGKPLPAIEFIAAQFHGQASFKGTCFSGSADFVGTTFEKKVSFTKSKFLCPADFSEAIFGDRVYFGMTTFDGEVLFTSTDFNFGVEFIAVKFASTASFGWVKARERGSLRLEHLSEKSVSHLEFAAGEVPLFTFHSCHWPVCLNLEVDGDKSVKHLRNCEELYRAMKQKAAAEHDQQQVSNWHFREKLMQLEGLLRPSRGNVLVAAFGDQALCKSTRRRAWWELFTSLAWRRCIMLFWFWSLSGFGERPRRAGWWLGGFILLPLLFLMPLKLIETGWSTTPDWQKSAEIIAEWVRCMPLVKLEATAPKQAPFVFAVRAGLSYLFQVAIGLQAALFALAVRNRFRR